MLYMTTRDPHDTYTVAHAIRGSKAVNGGLYVPFHLPELSVEELMALKGQSFGQNTAQILNLFFSCGLTGWDVEFAVGRHPVKAKEIKRRQIACEFWHNQQGRYSWLERTLAQRICGTVDVQDIPSWIRIGIRIAVLTAVYGDLLHSSLLEEGAAFDVAAPAGDFTAIMSLWYARKMGIPIRNIICGCNKNPAVWELLHLGQFRTDMPKIITSTPEVDIAVPMELERLIFSTLGTDEVLRYCDICSSGETYMLDSEALQKLNHGMFTAVVSSRLDSVIPNVYRTSGYIMGPYTALAYSALQDYQARTGENRVAFVLADKNPACDAAFIAKAMDVSERQLSTLLNRY